MKLKINEITDSISSQKMDTDAYADIINAIHTSLVNWFNIEPTKKQSDTSGQVRTIFVDGKK
jgi:hypothetical protein